MSFLLTSVPNLHGKTPLDFVPHELSGDWIKFIDCMTESLWPVNPGIQFHSEPSKGEVPDPSDALSIELAAEVASGRLKPEHVIRRLLKKSLIFACFTLVVLVAKCKSHDALFDPRCNDKIYIPGLFFRFKHFNLFTIFVQRTTIPP